MRKLLLPDPHVIGRPQGTTSQADAVGPELIDGAPNELIAQLSKIVGRSNVLGTLSDLVRYASDGSPYRRVPQVVVRPRNEHDLSRLMQFARNHGRKLTFRAAGSSLNGQATSDDILVDVKTHFLGMEVRNDGAQLWARSGVVLGDAQAVLGRQGVMLGPDPGSTAVCTIGGVVADNSGGMRCSVDRDVYHSIVDARIVLPSGTIVDTSAGDLRFQEQEPELHAGLIELRDRIRSDSALTDRLRKKFSIRNTNGIRLDAFLDEDQPVKILLKLMVSSEGIFGVVTESVINTVRLPRKKAVAWVLLSDLRDAANYVSPLMGIGAEACELLVAPVLKRSVANFREAPREWNNIPDTCAALLLEVGGVDDADLDSTIEKARSVLADADLIAPLTFDKTVDGQRGAWHIRNGLFGVIGSDRPQGTALITEDVCFPPALVGQGAADLLDLLASYEYPEMVMGHAAFGNLHFFILPHFGIEKEREKYAQFLEDLSELVVDKYDGSLKAEHGTGLNMAPFLQREWGTQAWELMWEVKNLLDPSGILAPDVKLTRKQDIHLQNFKSFPKIEQEINSCVECGFCEPVCPSRHVTLTPRQRIILRREMARQEEGSEVLAKLQEEYQYNAIDMCAADGSCSIACPISIDTGKVMKHFREKQTSATSGKVALAGAKKWEVIEKLVRGGLVSAKLLGTSSLQNITNAGRELINPDLLPSIPGDLPQAAQKLPTTHKAGAQAVYFSACINRMFGKSAHAHPASLSLPQAVVELGRRSGVPVWIPHDVGGRCCGTPWSSKGYKEGFKYHASQIVNDMWRWSDQGRLPIIVDASSCTHGILENIPTVLSGTDKERFSQLRILDVVAWLASEVIDHLTITETLGNIAVHPTCSIQHLGLDADLLKVAQTMGSASVPEGTHCCGSAGDRVLLHPELTESATEEERRSLNSGDYDCFVASNRTCEMGLEMIADRPFEHIAVVLERASRPVISP